MSLLAGEAPLPTGAELFGFLPKPVAVVIAVVLAIAYAIGEVSGKLNGPISKLLARRAERQEQKEIGWRARDRRVEELEQARKLQDGRIALLVERLNSQDDELRMLHRLSDHQRRAIRAHTDWDNRWVPQARARGMNIPDPPDLYVYLGDEEAVP